MVKDKDFAHFSIDKGIAEAFGGEGGYALMGPQGVMLRGFENKDKADIIDSPKTIIVDKKKPEPTIIENPGMPSEEFLKVTKSSLEKELAELSSRNFTSISGRTLYDALKASPLGKTAVTMCTNIRTPLSLDGIMQAAKETNSVAILQQAMSEFDYTWPNGYSTDNAFKLAEEAKQASLRNNFSDYLLKADHLTVKVDKKFLEDKVAQDKVASLLETILAENSLTKREELFNKAYTDKELTANTNIANALKAIKKALDLTKAEVAAGMTIYALDASFMPARLNILATSFLAGFIPANSSIEAEVGEIGGSTNSTVADALELITGIRYKETIKEDPTTKATYSELVKDENNNPIIEHQQKGLLDYGVKIDRLAINNGTAHGNNYDKDGNLIQTQMNIRMTAAIAFAIKPYNIEIVQHGVTGTPLSTLPQLRAAGIASAHVGTNWQNIAWETLVEIANTEDRGQKTEDRGQKIEEQKPESSENITKVKDLIKRILTDLVTKYGEKYKVTELKLDEFYANSNKNLAKLIGKELKNFLGKYKPEFDTLSDTIKSRITVATRKSALEHFNAFGTKGVADVVHSARRMAQSVKRKKEK
jgi:fructose/tagatose bisphosphate aldolase